MIDAELTDETFDRPASFDLAEFWTAWAAEHEASRWFYAVTVRVAASALSELERELGRHIRRAGGAVEVIEPDALRLSIADFAQRIVETYASSRAAAGRPFSRSGVTAFGP